MTTRSTIEAEGEFANYVRTLSYNGIGPDVYAGDIQDSLLSDITAVCRRAFKKKDVIVYVGIDSDDEDYEEGVVFTTEGIFCWGDNGKGVVGIKYSDITKVDFDSTEVFVEHNNTTTKIYLGEDAEEEKYPRYMYNFIMDLLEYEGWDSAEE